MKLTYYGHACFRVEAGDKHLIFDPFISPNPLAASIDVDAIPADYILLSHGHMDHVVDATRISKRTGAPVISNFEVATWFQEHEKLGAEGGIPLNHGGALHFDFGRVKYVNAVHSSVLPDGSYGGNPGGFVVEAADRQFYFSGDTALTMDMKLTAETNQLDFAVLPIGGVFTMDYVDAVKAAEFVNCKKVVGVHYDTFPVINLDKEAARKAFEAAGIELLLPQIGESIEL